MKRGVSEICSSVNEMSHVISKQEFWLCSNLETSVNKASQIPQRCDDDNNRILVQLDTSVY